MRSTDVPPKNASNHNSSYVVIAILIIMDLIIDFVHNNTRTLRPRAITNSKWRSIIAAALSGASNGSDSK